MNLNPWFLTYNERLSDLVHDKDKSNYTICMVPLSSVEGRDWDQHDRSKQGIEDYFPKVVEALDDSLQKHEAHYIRKN